MSASAAVLFQDHDAAPDLGRWGREMGAAIHKGLNRRVALPGYPPNDSSDNRPNALQLNAPSVPHQYGAQDMDRASPTVARNSANGRDEVRNGLHLALVTKIPTYRNPAKEVAHRADTSEGTVRSLRQANIPEAMVTLIMLSRAYPQFGGEVRRLMGMGDLDPDFQRELAALMRRVL